MIDSVLIEPIKVVLLLLSIYVLFLIFSFRMFNGKWYP